jgi:hypothetical protein
MLAAMVPGIGSSTSILLAGLAAALGACGDGAPRCGGTGAGLPDQFTLAASGVEVIVTRAP